MIKFRRIITALLVIIMIAQVAFYGNTIEVDAAASIPDEAVTFNGNKYYIFHDEMDWTKAKKFCEKLGGHLVTITSQKEQNFIDKVLNKNSNRLWIGGYRANGKSNVWKWVTGEKWKYTNWDDGEPNDSSNVISNENRASVWPNKWNDLNDASSEQSGFICEWETRPAKIKNVKISKVTKNSCVLKVTADKKKNSYKIKISLDPNFPKNKTEIITSKTATVKLNKNTLKKGLKANKTYFIRVCAYNPVGKTSGKWSKIYMFTTKSVVNKTSSRSQGS